MKQAILNLMRMTGVFDLFRLLHQGQALILTYHRFSTTDHDGHTPASVFDEQLAYLKAHYQVVTLSQLVELIDGNGKFPPRMAAITIDDGYRDAYEIAFPLLRRYDLPATVFVVTEFVERRGWLWTDKMRFLVSRARSQELSTVIDDLELRVVLTDEMSRRDAAEKVNSALKQLDDETKDETINCIAASLGVTIPQIPPGEYAAISWDEAREMDTNNVEIGSHTKSHPILTNINEGRLWWELSESKTCLEEILKRRVEHFCYPNGDYDERVRSEVIRAGYRSAVTTKSGLNAKGEDLLSLSRVHTERDLTHFMQSTCGFEQIKDRMRNTVKRRFSSFSSPLSKGTEQDAREY